MDFTALKNYLDRVVGEYKVPGVDCIVYKEHKEVFRYYTGYSDRENKIAMNGNELYFIFSMTKMLTCTAALQLLEKGKFLLSDPISKYLPEFEKMKISCDEYSDNSAVDITTGASFGGDGAKCSDGYAQNPITVANLFTMSAGLDYGIDADHIKKAVSEGKTSTRELVRAISESTLLFEPGTHYNYSLCHDVLGGLIEVVSGKKLGEYMKENIFDPLGMNDTFFGKPTDAKRLSRMAALYSYDANREVQRQPLNCVYNLSDEYESGGAGLTSTAADYALFLDAMANGGIGKNGKRILTSFAVSLMNTNHLDGKCKEEFDSFFPGYGYGLGVRTHMDSSRSGSLSPEREFGWDGAAGAFALADTKNKLSLTFFQHVFNWDGRHRNELRNVLYGCLEY